MWDALGAQCIVSQVLRVGCHWITLRKDAHTLLKSAKNIRSTTPFTIHLKELYMTTFMWLFTTWGMDILNSFPVTKGHVNFLIVTINYFTVWIEVEPLETITAQQEQNLFWKRVVWKHGLSHFNVIDNDW